MTNEEHLAITMNRLITEAIRAKSDPERREQLHRWIDALRRGAGQ